MAASLPLGIGKCSLAPASRAQIIDTLERSKQSQFIIATHSPILLAYPRAWIYQFDEDGIKKIKYEETEHYSVTKQFLNGYHQLLEILMEP